MILKAGIKSMFAFIIEIFFYGNIFISIASIAMMAMTLEVFDVRDVDKSPYYIFLFFGTLGLYNLHRIVGLKKLDETNQQERFLFAQKRTGLIILCIVLSALIIAYPIFQVYIKLKWAMMLPLFIGMAYSQPFFLIRLRDLPYIKIILIAFCWTWLTVYCPALWVGQESSDVILMTVERFMFVFAITIPFDIRDQWFDQKDQLKTTVSLLGVRYSRYLSFILLVGAFIIEMYLLRMGKSSMPISISWTITYILSVIAIKFANEKRHELYFMALLDGLMILPFVLFSLIVWLS